MTVTKPKPAGHIRAQAAKLIHKVAYQGESLSKILPPACEQHSAEQSAYLQAMVYGSVRHYIALQQILKPFLQKPIRKKELVIESLLVLGAYQLLFSRTKEHAIINETVNAVKPLKRLWAKALVNAVLRNIQRQPELAIKLPSLLNMPKWLHQQIQQDWPKQSEQIFKASDQQAPMWLRLHPKANRPAYLQQLQTLNITATAGQLSEHSLCLDKAVSVEHLPDFLEGGISVQDQAAQLAGDLFRFLMACVY